FAKNPIKRIGRNQFIRNVLYAIGNSGQVDLLSVVRDLIADKDAVVRDAAIWAQARLMQIKETP
ncbi:MAG: tRNA epoxyqueuosine(34) reductase QueG, partial [Proteobacteria bacterium]|nr:tRNA epoxyqueuosine(34) reductase QueG [Pseudomonadota bacterium]